MPEEEKRGHVSVEEEIRALRAAGWIWDRDKLVHPKDKETWREYQRIDSRTIAARSAQFEAEIEQAVRQAREQDRDTPNSGQ